MKSVSRDSQVARREPHKLETVGSNPTPATKRMVGRARPIASVLKTDRRNSHGGSNPSPSANLCECRKARSIRRAWDAEIAGSNPAARTILCSFYPESFYSFKPVIRRCRTQYLQDGILQMLSCPITAVSARLAH